MDTYQKNRNNSGESILDLAIGAVKRVAAWLAYWALVVYYALKSPALPGKDKAKIIAALAYLILPFDILPDAIPVVGVIDDAAILWAVFRLLVVIDDNIKAQAAERVRRWS